mmetsp:Transcript_17530/g.47808  ORF Transcript_17530/g.47808 Transcript_17530/m.47808 type:complete len:123 (-) Transcript_17530:308-676(-)
MQRLRFVAITTITKRDVDDITCATNRDRRMQMILLLQNRQRLLRRRKVMTIAHWIMFIAIGVWNRATLHWTVHKRAMCLVCDPEAFYKYAFLVVLVLRMSATASQHPGAVCHQTVVFPLQLG